MIPIRSFSILCTVCAILLLPGFVRADSYPKPTVEFSADFSMEASQGAGAKAGGVTGKLYSSKAAERREMVMGGHKSITIMTRGKPVVLVLIPEQNMYMEQQAPPNKDAERMMKEGDVKLTKLGTETVNGQSATKYHIEVMDKGSKVFDGFLWLTKDNIPVRIDGTSTKQGGHLRVDHTNIKIGTQDAKLFTVPAGYSKMQMPQMPNMPEGGMTKEQRQQMQDMMKQMQKQSGEKSGEKSGDGY
jgi:hypothetical protein